MLSLQEQPFTFEVLEKTLMNTYRENDNQVVNRGFYTSIYNEANGSKAEPLNLVKSEELLTRSYKVIPGCAQTYSKSINHHISGVTPAFLARGKGASVVDVDDNQSLILFRGYYLTYLVMHTIRLILLSANHVSRVVASHWLLRQKFSSQKN